jgi:hypothetical protein
MPYPQGSGARTRSHRRSQRGCCTFGSQEVNKHSPYRSLLGAVANRNRSNNRTCIAALRKAWADGMGLK